MKRHEIVASMTLLILELAGLVGLFYGAYFLRQITDGIPFIQLTIPFISETQFLPFVISGIILWAIIFSLAGLYQYRPEEPLISEIQRIVTRGFYWFLFYIGFVYLTTGFLFEKEIPRLIIIYVWMSGTIMSILIRVGVYSVMKILYKYGIIEKNIILILRGEGYENYELRPHIGSEYREYNWDDHLSLESTIKGSKVDTIFLLGNPEKLDHKRLVDFCSIYGIRFSYPKVPEYVSHITRQDSRIGDIPVVEVSALAMNIYDRIAKRAIDVIFSAFALILLAPLLLIIALAIKTEDPSGPIIFRNRRTGLGGKEFFLYKFRYMYWKYSVKDGYGIEKDDDSALQFEEELKKKANARKGPIYKIADDPRKTKIGTFIERLSIDEIPQLWNVLKGEMSLVGPRPHQPREIEHYDEHHFQLLTVKPGITGMAQVSGREKNSFEEEVAYDIYYIERYSLILDFMILAKTAYVVIERAFSKK